MKGDSGSAFLVNRRASGGGCQFSVILPKCHGNGPRRERLMQIVNLCPRDTCAGFRIPVLVTELVCFGEADSRRFRNSANDRRVVAGR